VIRCYIGLGSNQGDSGAIIEEALEQINASEGIEITGVAPLYRTAPQGYLEQDDFINTVAEINTTLSPLALLSALQQIETDLGRVRTVRWGPRTVDLDLLLYGDDTINLPQLQVPHPRMHQRAFVMVPLADLNRELQLAGERVADTAKRLAGEQRIDMLESEPDPGMV
jgi:2-amino-4-hydroxy-6-hydroxymethyldihydropteridine diphosphokinase